MTISFRLTTLSGLRRRGLAYCLACTCALVVTVTCRNASAGRIFSPRSVRPGTNPQTRLAADPTAWRSSSLAPANVPRQLSDRPSQDRFEAAPHDLFDAIPLEPYNPAPQNSTDDSVQDLIRSTPSNLFDSAPHDRFNVAPTGVTPVSGESLDPPGATAPIEVPAPVPPIPTETVGPVITDPRVNTPADSDRQVLELPDTPLSSSPEAMQPGIADPPMRGPGESVPPRTLDLLDIPPHSAPGPAQVREPTRASDSAVPFQRIRDVESEKQDRLQHLGNLIDSLADRIEHASTPVTPPTLPVLIEPESPSAAAEVPSVVPTDTDSVTNAMSEQPPVPGEVVDDGSNAEHAVLGERWLTAVPVVDQPVDRAALADSLFAIGEYAIALDAYRRVDLEETDQAARLWLRYQTACCLRNLGQTSEAAREYRRVTAEADSAWIGEQARWWLDIIDSRREWTERIEQMRATIVTLEGEADE